MIWVMTPCVLSFCSPYGEYAFHGFRLITFCNLSDFDLILMLISIYCDIFMVSSFLENESRKSCVHMIFQFKYSFHFCSSADVTDTPSCFCWLQQG